MNNRQYKDSGIEWIGRIPKEWSRNKINRTFRLIGSGTTPISSDNNAYEGTHYWIQSGDINGGDLYEAKSRISESALAKYSALSLYEAPFIIIAMYGASVGNISISHIDGCVNQACCVLAHSNINLRYAFYTLKSTQRYLIYKAVGGGQPNISQQILRQLWIPIPSKEEQQRIADYLDKKCGEIDGLISLQEQMIQTLTDYKQSVITEAVTKGLNPNAHLVPSGIDWIGDIPEGWSKDKVNRIFQLIGSGTTPSSSDNDAYEGTLNWIQSGDINGGDLYEAKNKISHATLSKYSALSVYEAPFIIVAMYGASVGNISISHINGCVNQACCVLANSTVDFKYAFYAIKSAQRYLIYKAVGGGQPNISQYTLRQLWIPVPSPDEQRAIASFLDTKCAEIDSLIALKRQKIEMLKEYKKSVIYEAVTGKTDIE